MSTYRIKAFCMQEQARFWGTCGEAAFTKRAVPCELTEGAPILITVDSLNGSRITGSTKFGRDSIDIAIEKVDTFLHLTIHDT